MEESKIPLLIISGPVGSGKTSVGQEVSNQLIECAIPHTFIDLDTLSYTYPRPSNDRFGSHLANMNLKDVWLNCASAGSRNLILARVIESEQSARDIAQEVPGSGVTICRLEANKENLVSRIRGREIGSGQDRHIDRALELVQSLSENGPADFIIDTNGRNVEDIAEEIVTQIEWKR